jgi:ABC-type multidrug transport system permease subunit
MYWLDPYHYLIEGFMVNELYDLTITCEEDDILNFRPPPGQTCEQYTQAFFASGGTGYVTQDSLSSTEMCRYCLYSKGEDYYARIGWTFDNRYVEPTKSHL